MDMRKQVRDLAWVLWETLFNPITGPALVTGPIVMWTLFWGGGEVYVMLAVLGTWCSALWSVFRMLGALDRVAREANILEVRQRLILAARGGEDLDIETLVRDAVVWRTALYRDRVAFEEAGKVYLERIWEICEAKEEDETIQRGS